MKKSRKWLYEKWREEHKKEEEQEEISKKLGVEKEKIIVKKVPLMAKAFEVLTDICVKIIFASFLATAVGLASLGATVLLNPDLRVYVLGVLKESLLF